MLEYKEIQLKVNLILYKKKRRQTVIIFTFKQIAWAPNKGIKDKLKNYWNVDIGCTYVPWNELNNFGFQTHFLY